MFKAPQLSIVVPTYREAENLPTLVQRIDAATSSAQISCEILIVDDNSCDGTEEVCRELAQRRPVKLIVREKERGLSSAVIAGMRIARGDVLLVLDADLSHPPEKIPDLYDAIASGAADFAIGSRYVRGGRTAGDWGLFRWLNSRVATWLAWPLTSARDPMAGFFALPRSAFAAHEHQLDPIGYKIGLELMVKCGCRRVAETPIFFADRLHGESKLNLREQLNYLRHLKRLYEFRFPERARLLQFGAVGASGMVVDLVCFVCALSILPATVARALAIWVAMTWNFAGNRELTFAAQPRGDFWPQYLSFCGSCGVGAVVNWLTSVALWSLVPAAQAQPWSPALAGALAGAAFNYLLCRWFVFRSADQPAAERTETAAEKPLRRAA